MEMETTFKRGKNNGLCLFWIYGAGCRSELVQAFQHNDWNNHTMSILFVRLWREYNETQF